MAASRAVSDPEPVVRWKTSSMYFPAMGTRRDLKKTSPSSNASVT